MANPIHSDATPFPPTEQPEPAEAPTPPPDDEKKDKKKNYISEDSSSDSDDSSEFSRRSRSRFKEQEAAARTVINIDNCNDLQIGNSYNFSKVLQYSKQNFYSEPDYGAAASNKSSKGPKPSNDILNSTREINEDDMYFVAENISTGWKKLARFLPPRNVFTDGQLKTFENNNPNNLEEVIYEMMKEWKRKHPESATIGNLANTLWNMGKGDIGEQLKS